MPLFLMSPPTPDWSLRGKANFRSQAKGASVAPKAALRDWLSVADAIVEAGGEVLVAPPPPHLALTGLPYTAEAGCFFRDGSGRPSFLLSRMTPAHRKDEPTYLAGFFAALGWRLEPTRARWEGQGDVLRVDAERLIHTYGEGEAARTEGAAYAEVAHRLSPRHLHLRFRASPWFHGNTFLGVFHHARTGAPTAVLCPEALASGEREKLEAFLDGVPVVEIDREASLGYATNALQVNETVIAPSGLPESLHALWRALELRVVTLDLPALFRSGGGAAVCLTDRLDGCAPEEAPEHLLYSRQRTALHAALEA